MVYFQCYSFDSIDKMQWYRILQLRQEIFVVEQNCPYLDLDSRDFEAYHLIGLNAENEILTYCRILPPGIAYQDYCSIGRVLTAAKFRKQKLGKSLMQEAIFYCNKLFPKYAIKISAQSYLLEFYSNLGFEASGRSYLEDGIPHDEMTYSIPS